MAKIMTFYVIAQSFTTSQRIQRSLTAVDMASALKLATSQIGDAFYVVLCEPA